MIDTETTPQPISPALRVLGWVGLWLCSALFLPTLAVWTQLFNTHRTLNLLSLGTTLFWETLGIGVLMGSLLTFEQWQNNRKPAKRRALPKPMTPKDRWRNAWAGLLMLGITILILLPVNPGSAVNWGSVLSGATVLALLSLLLIRCVKLTQPLRVSDETQADTNPLLPLIMPSLPLGVLPPKNKFRAEVSAREVVYRRLLSAQIGAGVGGLFFGSLSGGCFYFTLVGLGLVSASGMRGGLPLTLIMGGGFLLFLSAFVSILATSGRRELRVSPTDHTYIYRVCSPVRWKVLTAWAGKSAGEELGIPWQVLEYRGSLSEIAGIQRCEFSYKSNAFYTVLLCWQDPTRPPMRVGFSADEDKAREMQGQAAEDLGVPLLPDEVI